MNFSDMSESRMLRDGCQASNANVIDMDFKNVSKIVLDKKLKIMNIPTQELSSSGVYQPRRKPNSLMKLIFECYNYHRPLYIDPKAMWASIVYQVYLLFTYNSESIRKEFVDFDGKMKLKVPTCQIDDMTESLSYLVQMVIKDKEFYNWVNTKFSTSTPRDEIVFSMMFLGVFKEYFIYSCSMCGIPEINVLGTLEDWLLIKKNISKIRTFRDIFTDYNILKWCNDLEDMLDHFIDVKMGKIDTNYWNNFIKSGLVMSGSPDISGHCIVLTRFVVAHGRLWEHNGDRIDAGSLADEKVNIIVKINTRENKEYCIDAGNINAIELKDGGLYISPDYQYEIRPSENEQ